MAQLLTAAAQGNDNYTGIAARDTANALKVHLNLPYLDMCVPINFQYRNFLKQGQCSYRLMVL